jgi:hypothetical protein
MEIRFKAMVAVAGLLLAGSIGAAAEDAPREALGQIIAAAPVRVNGQAVPQLTVVFTGDVVSTGEGGVAVVRLLQGNSAAMGENSAARFFGKPASTTVSAGNAGGENSDIELRSGALTVLGGGPDSVRVSLLNTAITLQGRPGHPAICRLALVRHHGAVLAERGQVVIHAGGASVVLPPGKTARLEAGQQPGQVHIAGAVVDSMPDEVVLHPGERVEIALGLGQLVNVGDEIRTLPTGRVRIRLIGDLFLNAGARSAFKITNHNPESQYTRIDLARGWIRAEAVRLTKPGAMLEIRTPDGIASGAGATFMVSALHRGTEACVLDGTITVRRLNSAGLVRVGENQCTRIPSGQDPLPPAESTRRLQAHIYMTTVVGSAVATPPSRPSAEAIAGASGIGAAAFMDLGGFILIGDARHSLAQAKSKLGQAESQLNSAENSAVQATSEADAASGVAQGVANALQVLLKRESPGPPAASPSLP